MRLQPLVLYPLTFQPIFKERIWGGRNLEILYDKPLPRRTPIGESWEISDRPGDTTIVTNGSLAGKDLRWVMQHHEHDLLGNAPSQNGRFPLLIKILDATDRLSLQVHPPADKAAALGGDPKTEMWYIAQATPQATLFAGLKRGVTREEFERRIRDGTVAETFHRLPVKAGDALFLPSGRVHAIGAGLVIFEIQQNSDTTYRVFDWNRVGTDGKPRALHVTESLASINFHDFEPGLVDTPTVRIGPADVRSLVKDALFHVDLFRYRAPASTPLNPQNFQVIGVLEKRLTIAHDLARVELHPGQFALIPATAKSVELHAEAGTAYLSIRAPENRR